MCARSWRTRASDGGPGSPRRDDPRRADTLRAGIRHGLAAPRPVTPGFDADPTPGRVAAPSSRGLGDRRGGAQAAVPMKALQEENPKKMAAMPAVFRLVLPSSDSQPKGGDADRHRERRRRKWRPVARLVAGRNGATVVVEVKRRHFTATQTGTEAATGVAEKAAAWRGPQCRDPAEPAEQPRPTERRWRAKGVRDGDRDRQGRGDWGDLSRFTGDGGRSAARAGRNRRGRCERCGGREPIRTFPRPWRPHVWVACALARARSRSPAGL